MAAIIQSLLKYNNKEQIIWNKAKKVDENFDTWLRVIFDWYCQSLNSGVETGH